MSIENYMQVCKGMIRRRVIEIRYNLNIIIINIKSWLTSQYLFLKSLKLCNNILISKSSKKHKMLKSNPFLKPFIFHTIFYPSYLYNTKMTRNINPNLLHVQTTPANNSLTSINNSFLHETYQSYMET